MVGSAQNHSAQDQWRHRGREDRPAWIVARRRDDVLDDRLHHEPRRVGLRREPLGRGRQQLRHRRTCRALLGPGGVAVGAIAMVFVGNPFSAVSSAPELLPTAVGELGQLMPPGAGANLLRSAAYFDGHGAAQHVVVLVAWSVLGIAAIVEGHRRMVRRQGTPAGHSTDLFADSPLHDALTDDEDSTEAATGA